MSVVLDAGALIAFDRNDQFVTFTVEVARRQRVRLVSTAPAVAQAWREGARQARLARLIAMTDVRPVDLDEGKRTGELLARSETSDVVDALLALLVVPMDRVLTSDPDDVEHLLATRGVDADVIRV